VVQKSLRLRQSCGSTPMWMTLRESVNTFILITVLMTHLQEEV